MLGKSSSNLCSWQQDAAGVNLIPSNKSKQAPHFFRRAACQTVPCPVMYWYYKKLEEWQVWTNQCRTWIFLTGNWSLSDYWKPRLRCSQSAENRTKLKTCHSLESADATSFSYVGFACTDISSGQRCELLHGNTCNHRRFDNHDSK